MRNLQLLFALVSLAFATQVFAGEGLLAAPDGTDKAVAQQISDGIKAKEKGDLKAALSNFKKAVEMNPKVAEAHFNMAMTLHWMGDHGAAGEHFKHALKLGKNNPAIVNSATLKGHTGG